MTHGILGSNLHGRNDMLIDRENPDTSEMLCVSCNAPMENSFCSTCGQKRAKVPFTLLSVLNSFVDLFDFNRGYFFTVYSMIGRPGQAIDEYLRGATVRYHNPLRYTVTSLALIALSGLLKNGFQDNRMTELDILKRGYFPALIVYVIVFNYLLFRRKKTFVEHLIIGFYECSTVILLAMTYVMISPEDDHFVGFLLMAITVVGYIFWFLKQVFKGNIYLLIIKTFLLCGIAFIGITYFFARDKGIELF